MERAVDIKEISDGKLYNSGDLVKVGCNDCVGCHLCCTGMGKSIVLDPLDVHNLVTNLHTSFEALLAEFVELNVVDGMILPNLQQNGEEEGCAFLNEEGRCSIHAFRPGMCRLFPLGRLYENGDFQYFIQVHECPKENKSKVKVKKWLGISDMKMYEEYINTWHYFMMDLQKRVMEMDEVTAKKWNMIVLQTFYLEPFAGDFYEIFAKRMAQVKELF